MRWQLALLCWLIDGRIQHDPERIGFFEWLGNRLDDWNWRPWVRRV